MLTAQQANRMLASLDQGLEASIRQILVNLALDVVKFEDGPMVHVADPHNGSNVDLVAYKIDSVTFTPASNENQNDIKLTTSRRNEDGLYDTDADEWDGLDLLSIDDMIGLLSALEKFEDSTPCPRPWAS